MLSYEDIVEAPLGKQNYSSGVTAAGRSMKVK